MDDSQRRTLDQMQARIAQIENLALELKQLGSGIPVIDKNVRTILAAVYILKFGISDVAEMRVV